MKGRETMTQQKIKNTSIAMDQDMKELLKVSAIKMKSTSSKIVRELIEKYLDLVVRDKEEIPVVIRIPTEKLGDPDTLKTWLVWKAENIAKALTNENSST